MPTYENGFPNNRFTLVEIIQSILGGYCGLYCRNLHRNRAKVSPDALTSIVVSPILWRPIADVHPSASRGLAQVKPSQLFRLNVHRAVYSGTQGPPQLPLLFPPPGLWSFCFLFSQFSYLFYTLIHTLHENFSPHQTWAALARILSPN